MPWFRKYKAKFFNPNGTFNSSKRMPISKKTFSHKAGKYNINPHASYTKLTGLIWDTFHYYYIIGHPDPVIFTNELENKFKPYMDAEQYETVVETKVIRDANNMDKKNPFADIPIHYILIGLGAIAVIIYFATGGSLT